MATILHQNKVNGILLNDVADPAKLIASMRCRDIQHSIKRINLRSGWAFLQLSVSDYFKALAMLTGNIADQCDDDMLCVPLRCFNENVLLTPDGRSLISQLMNITDQLVIEDMDVTTQRLREHTNKFGLFNLRITNAANHRQPHRASVSLIEKCN